MPTLAQIYKRPADKIPPNEISHVVGDGNYVHIYFIDGSKATFGRTLKILHTEHPHLIRISKSVLISPDSITSWKRTGPAHLRVTIANADYLVSRRRVDEVVARIKEDIIYKSTPG